MPRKAGSSAKNRPPSTTKPLPKDAEALRVLLRAVEQALRYIGPIYHRQSSRLAAWKVITQSWQGRKSSSASRTVKAARRKLAALAKGTDEQVSAPVFPWRVIEPFIESNRFAMFGNRAEALKPSLAKLSQAVSEGSLIDNFVAIEQALPQMRDAVQALESQVAMLEEFQNRLIERLSNQRAIADVVQSNGSRRRRAVPKPKWDRIQGVLLFQGVIVRRLRTSIATRIVPILDAFETQGWPVRIADPYAQVGDKQKLREAVQNLNERLKLIRFEMDGTGSGVHWRVVKRPRTGRAPAAHRH